MTKINVDRFDIERIANLYQAQEYEKCNEYAKRIVEKLGDNTGPWLCWVRGVCEDMLENPFKGLLLFKEALAGDPYNYTYLSALATNLTIFRNELILSLDKQGSLQYVQNAHKYLVEAGEFSSTHQYLVARNYIKHSHLKEAELLVQGLLINNPKDAEILDLQKLLDLSSTNRMAS